MSLERAIEMAMREQMLDPAYRGFVMLYLGRPDDHWRQCCNGSCEPCVLQIARVVDRVRELCSGESSR
jgi:hypothetical protein